MISSVRIYRSLGVLFALAWLGGASVRGAPAPFLGASTLAESAADTLRLTLDESVTRALAEGEDIRLAEANYSSARAVYLQARATAFPQFSLSSAYSRQIESVFQSGSSQFAAFSPDQTNLDPIARITYIEDNIQSAAMGGIASLFSGTGFGSKNTYTSAITVRQKLFEGGSIWSSIATAKHAIHSALSAREDRRDDVILQVREAYLNALLADRGVRIAELALRQADSELERVELRKDAGSASEFALLQAQVQRDNQIPLVLQARTQKELAYLELARLSNIPATTPLGLTTPVLEDAAIPEQPVMVDTTGLVGEAMRNHALTALEQEVEARGHAVTVAASGKWPSISAVGSYSRLAYPSDLFPVRDDWKKDVSAGVQATWNIFDGYRTKGEIQQRKVEQTRAQLTLWQTQKLVREAVIRSELDLNRAAADLRARSRTVDLAKRAYELASLRFDEGASDLLEVQDARTAYQIAQTNEAQARHAYFVSLARLERYTGRPAFTSALAAVGK
jgi:outer membrane protein